MRKADSILSLCVSEDTESDIETASIDHERTSMGDAIVAMH